jgi:hypothetical protein
LDNSKALQDSLAGIESRLTAIESQLETNRRQIESSLSALQKGPLKEEETAPLSAGEAFGRINQATESMAEAESQSQVLAAYLEQATAMASRGILFLKEGEQYIEWQSIGFDSVQVEPISTQDQSDPIIRATSSQQVVVSGENLEGDFPWLSESEKSSRMSLCMPLVFGDTVPVVLYLDSPDEVPVAFLELLTHLAVLILKNQYLQQLTALESPDGGGFVIEGGESPEPLQFGQDEAKPLAETIQEPASVKPDGPTEMTAGDPTSQPAGTRSDEETRLPEDTQEIPQPEPVNPEEATVDSEQTLILPKDILSLVQVAERKKSVILPDLTAPEMTEVDPEQTVILTHASLSEEARVDLDSTITLPNHTAPEGTEVDPEPPAIRPGSTPSEQAGSDPEATRAVSEFNLPEEREPDLQLTALPPEPSSQEEAADPEPVPEPHQFTYKKVPAVDEEIPAPPEDEELGS